MLIAIKDLTNGVHSGFSLLAKRIDQIQPGIELEQPDSIESNREHPGMTGEEKITPFTPQESDFAAYDIMLKKIDKSMLETSDPKEFDRLLDTRKKIRAQRGREISAAKAQEWRHKHPDEWREARYGPEEPEIREPAAPPTEADVDRIAQEVGVTKEGGLDPQALHGQLTKVMSNPLYAPAARKIAKSLFGIDDLDGAIGMLGQVVADPGKSQQLGAAIGTGLAGLVHEKLDQFIKPKQQQQQTGGAQAAGVTTPPTGAGPFTNSQGLQYVLRDGAAFTVDGRRMWNRNGEWVDPTRPYLVPTGPGVT